MCTDFQIIQSVNIVCIEYDGTGVGIAAHIRWNTPDEPPSANYYNSTTFSGNTSTPLDDSSVLYNKPVHPSSTGVEPSEAGELGETSEQEWTSNVLVQVLSNQRNVNDRNYNIYDTYTTSETEINLKLEIDHIYRVMVGNTFCNI